jgi:hypothetical protein
MDLVKLYTERDEAMKLDKKDLIQKHIKKLGYYNINFDTELEKNLLYHYKMDNTEVSFYEYKELNSAKLYDTINNRIKRSNVLNKFLDTDLNEDFYNKCTVEELVYLGY